ncbi:MAG: hypothetical protein V3U16_03575, partial [Candidatus Neomarinimicrobiota bacterium]
MFKLTQISNFSEIEPDTIPPESTWRDHIMIYTDNQPEIEFDNPKYEIPIKSNLWYHNPHKIIYTTFVTYWEEKLAVVDPQEAGLIIDL